MANSDFLPLAHGRAPQLQQMMRALVYALVASLTRAATTTTTNFRGEDTWVVLVGASRYFANYRHAANVLAMRRIAQRLGVPRERLLVLLAEDPTFDGRNPHRGRVFISANGKRRAADDLAGDWGANATHLFADVDYAGDEVTPELVRNLLTGRLGASTPRSRRLDSGPSSNVLVYLTGHGGDEFLKFHDSDELSAVEIADAVAEMRAKGRYGRLVLVADTCQAGSLLARLSPSTTPNVLGVASAKLGENAYAAGADAVVGVALADRFTEHVSKFFDGNRASSGTWGDFERSLRKAPTRSTLVVEDAAWGAPDWRSAPLAAFFGSEPTFHLTPWPP